MQTEREFPTDATGLPNAGAPDSLALEDGERFALRIAPVKKAIGDQTVRMLAYNGSVPGPTLRVRQGSELWVDVENAGDLESTVHWHGLRLENASDGTTLTQAPIQVGGRFSYRLAFPDPGIYWYHPHIREDYGQELGLYGNVIVEPADADYWPAAHRELALTVDDVLIEDGRIARFERSQTTYVAMGRFGNVFLVNGEPDARLSVRRGEVVRFYLTNTANTRVFNLAFRGGRMKLVGGDSGRYERERWVESVVIAPSERAVVDVLFDGGSELALEHRTPERTHSLMAITVDDTPAEPSLGEAFARLRVNADMVAERERARAGFDAEPDKTLSLVAEMNLGEPEGSATYVCPMHPEEVSDAPGRCAKCGMKLLPAAVVRSAKAAAHHHDHGGGSAVAAQSFPSGIEWEDDMVAVNRITTPENTRWKLVEPATGAEGMAIGWRFRQGERVKIRLVNTMDSDHPMHHPFHVHGAGRFLILARNAIVEPNLVWKDTVLVTTGETVDILLELTNPGLWMAHCHIAEHHESGMMMRFEVA